MRNIFSGLFVLFLLSFFISCSKDKSGKINTNDIHVMDFFGNPLSNRNDNQWQKLAFTQREIALFNALDMVSLSGTTVSEPIERLTGYPNPTEFHLYVGFRAASGSSVNTILKWVMVNDRMQPLASGWEHIKSDTWAASRLNVFDLPKGKHRIYITLSAENKPHYFTTWGNVQVGF